MRPSLRPAALLAASLVLAAATAARAEPIGDVNTAFQWIGPDHKIVVEAYDDPKVGGVTCYVSRAKTGGIKGALGWPRTRRRRRSPAARWGRCRSSSRCPSRKRCSASA